MKKVFIGVLAALMLFAFTACDNKAPQAPLMGNQIEGIELVSAPDYLTYETIDPAKVQLNVIKNDGSKIPYTGTELQMEVPTTLKAGANAVKVTYAGLDFYVNIPAYAPELFTFDVRGLEATEIPESGNFDLTGLKVSVMYDDNKTADATDYVFGVIETKLSGNVPANVIIAAFADDPSNVDVDDVITISDANIADAEKNIVEAALGFDVTVSGTKTLKVVEAAATVELTEVSLAQIDTEDGTANGKLVEVFNVGTNNKISNAAIKVSYTLKNADGTVTPKTAIYQGKATTGVTLTDAKAIVTTPVTLAKDGDVVIILQNYVSGYGFTTTKSSATDILATIKVKVGSDVVEKKDVPLSISAINNYVSEAVFEDLDTNPTTWEIDDPIKAEQFKITYTWAAPGKASYDTNENTPTIGSWTPSYSNVKENTPEGKTAKVNFTYNGDRGISSPNKTPLVVEATLNVVKGE